MPKQNIAIFSFFSGSGFLDLGFEKAGYNIEFVNEFNPSFLKAYKYSRNRMNMPSPKFGYHNTDINVYLENNKNELLKYIDICKNKGALIGFIGGPPCPDFSVGGKNKGKDGENGKLSLTYIKLITEMKPDFFLFENVKGLWRTQQHRVFYEELKTQLINSNYSVTERLTNALEFGVPQDRDRILLFGVKSMLLPKSNIRDNIITNFHWKKYMSYDLTEVKEINWPDVDDFGENSHLKKPKNIIQDLTVQYWFDNNQVESHANAKAHFKPRQGLEKMKTICEGDVSKKSYKRLHRWRFSPTAAYGNNEVHLHPCLARRISASEAMAIQSLPSEFELPSDMTLTDMFKTIGNGVPFLLSNNIAKTIYDYLEEEICVELQDTI